MNPNIPTAWTLVAGGAAVILLVIVGTIALKPNAGQYIMSALDGGDGGGDGEIGPLDSPDPADLDPIEEVGTHSIIDSEGEEVVPLPDPPHASLLSLGDEELEEGPALHTIAMTAALPLLHAVDLSIAQDAETVPNQPPLHDSALSIIDDEFDDDEEVPPSLLPIPNPIFTPIPPPAPFDPGFMCTFFGFC